MQRLTAFVLVALFSTLLICTVSCSPKPTPTEIALQSKTAGRAPSAADVIQIAPPTEPIAVTAVAAAPIAADFSEEPLPLEVKASVLRHWLMLVAILLVLFFVSLILFHNIGRRLRQKSFHAHSPTRHVDIWASHKPPQFLDP